MTAWSILISNSTLHPSAIAWDHLNNQNSGTGGVEVVMGASLLANALELLETNITNVSLFSEVGELFIADIVELDLSASIIETLEAKYDC